MEEDDAAKVLVAVAIILISGDVELTCVALFALRYDLLQKECVTLDKGGRKATTKQATIAGAQASSSKRDQCVDAQSVDDGTVDGQPIRKRPASSLAHGKLGKVGDTSHDDSLGRKAQTQSQAPSGSTNIDTDAMDDDDDHDAVDLQDSDQELLDSDNGSAEQAWAFNPPDLPALGFFEACRSCWVPS